MTQGNSACEQGDPCDQLIDTGDIKYKYQTYELQKNCPVNGQPPKKLFTYDSLKNENKIISGLSEADIAEAGKKARFVVLSYPKAGQPINMPCKAYGGSGVFGQLVENAICEEFRVCINGDDECDPVKNAQSPGSGTCWALRDQVNDCSVLNFCANECFPQCSEGGGALKPRLRHTQAVGGNDPRCQHSKRKFIDMDGNNFVGDDEALFKVTDRAEKFVKTDCLRTLDEEVRAKYGLFQEIQIKRKLITVIVTITGQTKCVKDDKEIVESIEVDGSAKVEPEIIDGIKVKTILQNGGNTPWGMRYSGGGNSPDNRGCLRRFEVFPWPRANGQVQFGWPCYNTDSFPGAGANPGTNIRQTFEVTFKLPDGTITTQTYVEKNASQVRANVKRINAAAKIIKLGKVGPPLNQAPNDEAPFEEGVGNNKRKYIIMFSPSSLALSRVIPTSGTTAENLDKWSGLSIRELDSKYDITDCYKNGNLDWKLVNDKLVRTTSYTPLDKFKCIQRAVAFKIKLAAEAAYDAAMLKLDKQHQLNLSIVCKDNCANALEILSATSKINIST